MVLLAVARPPIHRLTRRPWWPALALGLIFAVMNLTLYSAIERIGLGLAVTLEFLRPLTVALLARADDVRAPSQRSPRSVCTCPVLPGPSSDLVGIGVALAAAAAWGYSIVPNKLVEQRLPGLQAPGSRQHGGGDDVRAVLVWPGTDGRLWGWPLALAVVAGLLSSAIPYAADLTALRFGPVQFFGTFSSVQPAFAALAGMLILGQWLAGHEWLGIAIIAVKNVIATRKSRRYAPSIPCKTSAGAPV